MGVSVLVWTTFALTRKPHLFAVSRYPLFIQLSTTISMTLFSTLFLLMVVLQLFSVVAPLKLHLQDHLPSSMIMHGSWRVPKMVLLYRSTRLAFLANFRSIFLSTLRKIWLVTSIHSWPSTT